jgi:hypothetical protein
VHGRGSGEAGPAAACVIANDCPAIVSDEFRTPPAFGSTVKPTTPEPLPGEPDVIVIQLAALVAAQAHPAVVDTVT